MKVQEVITESILRHSKQIRTLNLTKNISPEVKDCIVVRRPREQSEETEKERTGFKDLRFMYRFSKRKGLALPNSELEKVLGSTLVIHLIIRLYHESPVYFGFFENKAYYRHQYNHYLVTFEPTFVVSLTHCLKIRSS